MLLNHKSSAVLAAVCIALGGLPLQTHAKDEKKADKAASGAKAEGRVLDNFIKADWSPARDSSSEIRISLAAGPEGSAIKVAYDLKNGKWVALSKGFAIDEFKGKAISFKMKAKGANNNLEVKLVDEDGTNYGVKRPLLSETEGWSALTFNEADFSYWWGGDPVLGRIKDIYFAISAGDGGAGEMLISDLRMGVASKDGNIGKGGMVFDGQTKDGWMGAKGEGSTLTLETGPGEKGKKAMAMKFSIPAGQWVSIRRAISADLSSGSPKMTLRLKGEGDPCDVEVKLIDRDDSTFAKIFPGMTGNGKWEEVVIPFSEFNYMWGGDSELDQSLIRYLDIAISGAGGAGKLWVSEIKITK